MCGIAGWFDMSGVRLPNRALIQQMTDAIRHRGPDGEGIFVGPGVGLGHRRLAIIDLAGGSQPMFNETNCIGLTFNGEIYNFKDLRQQLASRGYRFRTNSDTEVILHAWAEWGTECVNHLSGMFAFALWDSRQRTLFLARDRFGEKPLYYAMLPDRTLIFGSELKALLVHAELQRIIDPYAVEEYFALGYIAEPRTIYQGVSRLAAGHSLLVQCGSEPILRSYWSPIPSELGSRSMAEVGEQLVSLLGSAVRAQMVSDVPLGAFLSGGTDSSAVVALAAQASEQTLKCLSIGFSDPRYDETEYGRQVADRYAVDRIVETVDGNDTGPVDRLANIFDEPFGDSSALPCFHLARLARRHVTVAISGDGGDELMGGYRRHWFHGREERLRGFLPDAVRAPLFGTLANIYPQLDWAPRFLRARQTFRELSLDTLQGYFWNASITDDDSRRRLFSEELRSALGGYHGSEVFRLHMARSPSKDPVTTAQYVDLKTWLPSDILTKVDRTSMANALEVRVPMLDPAFAGVALGLSTGMKFRNGHRKFAFKQAFKRMLPDDVLFRPKQGFSVPLASWFRGPLGDRFETEILPSLKHVQSGFLREHEISRLLGQHRSGVHDHSRVLWLVWMFSAFLTKVHAATPPPLRAAA